MKPVLGKGILLISALAMLAPSPASAEFSIFVYFGKSLTNNSDLHLKKGNADLRFDNVRWDDRSFKSPIFYGVRASYWFDRREPWGVAVDFTHAKAILRKDGAVPVRGFRDGSPVAGREPITDTIRHFELSHGLNMLTFNALHRWFPAGARDLSPLGRLQSYAGLGAGFSIPHVEAHIKDERTGRYQLAAGPVMNGMLGLNYDFIRSLSGMLEYKLSYSDVRADLKGGGYMEAETFTNQFISGLAGNLDPE